MKQQIIVLSILFISILPATAAIQTIPVGPYDFKIDLENRNYEVRQLESSIVGLYYANLRDGSKIIGQFFVADAVKAFGGPLKDSLLGELLTGLIGFCDNPIIEQYQIDGRSGYIGYGSDLGNPGSQVWGIIMPNIVYEDGSWDRYTQVIINTRDSAFNRRVVESVRFE